MAEDKVESVAILMIGDFTSDYWILRCANSRISLPLLYTPAERRFRRLSSILCYAKSTPRVNFRSINPTNNAYGQSHNGVSGSRCERGERDGEFFPARRIYLTANLISAIIATFARPTRDEIPSASDRAKRLAYTIPCAPYETRSCLHFAIDEGKGL